MRQFLIVGRTGVGKSSFINSTFGAYIAKTSDFEAAQNLSNIMPETLPWAMFA
jgi:predicted GTPase